jgi:hypothetical protein
MIGKSETSCVPDFNVHFDDDNNNNNNNNNNNTFHLHCSQAEGRATVSLYRHAVAPDNATAH